MCKHFKCEFCGAQVADGDEGFTVDCFAFDGRRDPVREYDVRCCGDCYFMITRLDFERSRV